MLFEEMIAGKPQPLQNIALQLRELILQTDKRIEEKVYGGAKIQTVLYHISNPNQVLYGITLNDKRCILFLHFTDAADTGTLKLEGKGKHAMQVKFTELDDAMKNEVKKVFKNILAASGY